MIRMAMVSWVAPMPARVRPVPPKPEAARIRTKMELPTKQDQCPKVAGVREKGGCPDTTDTDKDGVLDRDDQCPIEPGLADNKGCPDRDEDRDGIVDRLDKCPKAAGSKEDEGCPLMEMADDRIKLGRPIRFMQDSVTVDSGSRAGLAAVAKAIRDDKTLTSVVIEVSASGDKRAAKGWPRSGLRRCRSS